MTTEIDTRQVAEVENEVGKIYAAMFPDGNRSFISNCFNWANDCFTGRYQDYLPIDARYHDFEHTLQVTLCMARLLRGRHFARTTPQLSQETVELGLLAILMHDTGYLKKRDDAEGTGAKYTMIHVERSMEFAAHLLREKGFSDAQISSVQNMIRCTGLNVKLATVSFRNEQERIAGYALGTADLLGQMAARDYVDKLPVLYAEFAEAAAYHAGEVESEELFVSAEDLIQKTPSFWDKFVKHKIESDFRGLYRFLNDPFPTGPNWYIERIEENMTRIRASLEK